MEGRALCNGIRAAAASQSRLGGSGSGSGSGLGSGSVAAAGVAAAAQALVSRTTLAHAVAGSVGSMVAMSLFFPLDRVRTFAQLAPSSTSSSSSCSEKKKTRRRNALTVLLELVESEGWQSLYQGLGPMLIALGCSNFVYFYWYTALKSGMMGARDHMRALAGRRVSRGKDLGTAANLAMASIAGTVNVLVCTPLWVAYTRLALRRRKEAKREKSDGLFSTLADIARTDGLSKLWSGLLPSLILVSNPTVQFVSYEKLKSTLLMLKRGSIPDNLRSLDDVKQSHQGRVGEFSNTEYLVLGALAKMVATVVTYPLQVAQSRLRASAAQERSNKAEEARRAKPKTTLQFLVEIYKREGLGGLYAGMDAKLLQTCLTSAFMFLVYERLWLAIYWLVLRRKRRTKMIK